MQILMMRLPQWLQKKWALQDAHFCTLKIIKMLEQQGVHSKFESPTFREKEVLNHIFSGKFTEEISKQFGIAVGAASGHRPRILNKLEISGVINLVLTPLKYRSIPNVDIKCRALFI